MPSYRTASQTIIVDHIMAARNEKIDGALWSMHTRIHGKFRNALQKVYICLIQPQNRVLLTDWCLEVFHEHWLTESVAR